MIRKKCHSEDWSTCTLCDQKLERNVCMCCGICVKKNKKGKPWNWAIGTNKGCDKHLQKGDFEFPKEFPKCKHIIAKEKHEQELEKLGWTR